MTATPYACPRCGADLTGPEIPEDRREHFGGSTHFSRVVGQEFPGRYDGVLFWQCPDCRRPFHRFPSDHHLHEQAEQAMQTNWGTNR